MITKNKTFATYCTHVSTYVPDFPSRTNGILCPLDSINREELPRLPCISSKFNIAERTPWYVQCRKKIEKKVRRKLKKSEEKIEIRRMKSEKNL